MPPVPSSPPPPHHGFDHPSLHCVDRPHAEEVHVLLLGLDGIAASLAVHLLRCGVLSLNVNDPAPVAEDDVVPGVYRRADVGRPRETVLRRRLRELDPRCAPVSGPGLFPGTLLPATVVVRSVRHGAPAGSRPHEGAVPLPDDPWGGCGIDPRHPLVSVHLLDGVVVRWPVVPWAHRPCPDCLRATLGRRQPPAPGTGRAGVLEDWARPAYETAVAARLAVDVLALGLDALWVGTAAPADAEAAREEDTGPGWAAVLHPPFPGCTEWLEVDRGQCLCGLAQE